MDATSSKELPTSFPELSRRLRWLSLIGGVASATTIFGVLAISFGPSAPEPEAEIYSARQVSLPLDTPPPPVTPSEVSLAVQASPIRLELTASSSPVRIQVPEAPVLSIEQAPPAARATVVARFDLRASAVRPQIDVSENDSKHIFDRSQVDQRPMPVDKVQPRISTTLANDVEPPRRTVLLLVVNVDGTVGEIRLMHSANNEVFDQRIIEAVREWKFSPAIRRGRKVRCWVQQAVNVNIGTGSRFSYN